jgi:hypothetical protein
MTFDERDVLLKAASIVEEGWCQGTGHIYYSDLRVKASCAYGAIYRAVDAIIHGAEERARLANAASHRLRDAIGREGIFDWNDAPGRTKEEVATAMREAANGNLG